MVCRSGKHALSGKRSHNYRVRVYHLLVQGSLDLRGSVDPQRYNERPIRHVIASRLPVASKLVRWKCDTTQNKACFLGSHRLRIFIHGWYSKAGSISEGFIGSIKLKDHYIPSKFSLFTWKIFIVKCDMNLLLM